VRDQPDTISEAHYPNDARVVFPAASERRGWDHERAHPSR
jgi:hypothetical protein